MDIEKLVRKNILALKPYSSARDEFKGEASIYLDANENPYGSPYATAYNRYPDPLQQKVKQKIAAIKGVPVPHIFLGNGSDEAIDIVFRIFCEPTEDNVIVCPPTYGMYTVSANINNVAVKEVSLTADFQLNVPEILAAVNEKTKLLFICSPNNPTGNSMAFDDVEFLLNNFPGILVIDEAYINYARSKSYIQLLTEYDNLVIVQTFSKAWGLAGLRLGMAFSNSLIVELMNKVKPPYNVNDATAQIALQAMEEITHINTQIKETVAERQKLSQALRSLVFVKHVFPSDANFVLVRMDKANEVYTHLQQYGVIVRNRSNVVLCENCLRITVGTPEENEMVIEKMKLFNA